jgi:uncharacterized metal-binding protein YceD (DUF177 family)
MSKPAPPWSVPVKLADITESGRRVTVEADAAALAGLAGALGVDSVQQAGATFDLSHWGRDGLHVAGRVTARVSQSCVVTLEPVVNAIDEAVDVDFAPPEKAMAGRPKSEDESPSSIEGPEPLAGDSIDLGALATEYLILGVDPYPRKPGIAFDAPSGGEKTAEKAADGAEGSPFAALAALKKGTVKD